MYLTWKNNESSSVSKSLVDILVPWKPTTGGYYGRRRTLWEEAGFINWLQARSEDMVSGATCPDKPGPAHQELSRPRKQSAAVKVILIAAKVIFISEKDNCDQQQKIIWSGLEVESNDRKPPLMTSATKHDDGSHLGRGLKEKLASEKIAAVKLGSCLIPWCKTNDKVAKFVWQNPHRLSDQHHSYSCHIILWNIGVWQISRDSVHIMFFFGCTFFPVENDLRGKFVWPSALLFPLAAYLIWTKHKYSQRVFLQETCILSVLNLRAYQFIHDNSLSVIYRVFFSLVPS